MTERLQVLLSAYQCGPGEGSVSQIGWEWYSRLAQHAAVTLVTHVRNRAALESRQQTAPDSQIVYVDTEAFAGPLYRVASRLFPRSQHAVFLISSLDFFVFDRKAVRMLRSLQEKGHHWDIAHCVTPVSPVASPTIHCLGMPVVLGPWNGGLKSPTTFPEFMKQDSSWLYPIRNLGKIAELLNRGIARSAQVLTATSATAQSIPKQYLDKSYRMLENGVDLANFCSTPWPTSPSSSSPLRVLFVGRLVPFKGVSMLLEAVKNVLASTPVELVILGDGPERVSLEKQTAALGLSEAVTFCGNQSLREVSTANQNAHVFCLPSVRESGGAVLLEAMASARPVIALKYGGPAELITEDVGHAILPLGREYVVEQLTASLLSVVKDPEIWQQKGLAGRQRSENEFSWEAKVEQAFLLYQRLIRERQTQRRVEDHISSGKQDVSLATPRAGEGLRISHE